MSERDGNLHRATRALRELTEAERVADRELADETRDRVLSHYRGRRRRRRPLAAAAVAIAICLSGTTAAAWYTGALPAPWSEPRAEPAAATSRPAVSAAPGERRTGDGDDARGQAPAVAPEIEPLPNVASGDEEARDDADGSRARDPHVEVAKTADNPAPARERGPRGRAAARPPKRARETRPTAEPPDPPEPERPATEPTEAPRASAPGDASPAASLDPADRIELEAFRLAHELHFERGADPATAVAAWNRYLRRWPEGRLVVEARYNRAIALIKLGRTEEAARQLRPFAAGEADGYRREQARALLRALDAR